MASEQLKVCQLDIHLASQGIILRKELPCIAVRSLTLVLASPSVQQANTRLRVHACGLALTNVQHLLDYQLACIHVHMALSVLGTASALPYIGVNKSRCLWANDC